MVTCQWRVVASLEPGKRSRATLRARTRSRCREGRGSDEGIEAEPPDHDQNRFNVPVGECVDVLEDLGGGHEGFPFERATNQVDDGEWEV